MSEPLPLGMMVVAGFETHPLEKQLSELARADIRYVEIYPRWIDDPDPEPTRASCASHGITIHSVHGVWGTESLSGDRIDLGSPEAELRRRSLDEVARSVAYAGAVGASCLVVHPGVVSGDDEQAARTDALRASLEALLPTAHEHNVRLCLENMPPGVGPGTHVADLVAIVEAHGDPMIGICLDTGHAHLADGVAAAIRCAGRWLATTHVHDNDGSRDSHLGPLAGTVPWADATRAFFQTGYTGPLTLECVSWFREDPSRLSAAHLAELRALCRMDER